MRTFTLTLLLLLCLVTTITLGACASRPTRPPNIILIMADDLGAGELGCYGQSIIKTPNIDALASRGVRFVNAYSGAPVCAPSRCTLLTGLHTGHAAIRDNHELKPDGQMPLPSDAVTIASVLKPAGYATACIGKWGLGMPETTGDPARHGFDLFFGYYCQRHAHNHAPAFLFRNGSKVGLEGNPAKAARGDTPMAHYAPDLMRDEALAFINANADRPFLLYYATTIPHLALQVPQDSLAPYIGAFEDPAYDGKKGYLAHNNPRAAYAAMVTRLDRDIGDILARIDALGLTGETLVVFTSDNGPTYTGGADSTFFNSADGRRGLKGQLYDGGIRVPLIAAWPGHTAPGQTSTFACANWDLFPTLAEAAGVPIEPRDGVSLLPHLASPTIAQDRPQLYWETPAGAAAQAVRIGSYKGVRTKIRSGASQIELYDLATDPGEKHDIAAQHLEVVEFVRRAMSARTPAAIPAWDFPTP